MLQLRQLNLQFSFPRSCSLGENIQNQRRPIQNLAVENSLQIPALCGRQLIIENHRIHVRPAAFMSKFIGLPLPDECCGAGRRQLLDSFSDHLATGSNCQFGKLLQ